MDWLSQNRLCVAVGISVAWYSLRANLGGHGAGGAGAYNVREIAMNAPPVRIMSERLKEPHHEN